MDIVICCICCIVAFFLAWGWKRSLNLVDAKERQVAKLEEEIFELARSRDDFRDRLASVTESCKRNMENAAERSAGIISGWELHYDSTIDAIGSQLGQAVPRDGDRRGAVPAILRKIAGLRMENVAWLKCCLDSGFHDYRDRDMDSEETGSVKLRRWVRHRIGELESRLENLEATVSSQEETIIGLSQPWESYQEIGGES